MMYNTRYLPENFDQCRLEKTILRQFPYNLSVRSSWNALIQDGGKYHEKAYWIATQGAHKHFFDRDARPRTNLNYPEK